MHVRRLSRQALKALTLLLIFMSAFGVKALHTHPDSYYAAIDASAEAQAGSAFSDNCPICHFSFSPYMVSQTEACAVFFTVLTFAALVGLVCPRIVPIRHFALRAPPAVGLKPTDGH